MEILFKEWILNYKEVLVLLDNRADIIIILKFIIINFYKIRKTKMNATPAN